MNAQTTIAEASIGHCPIVLILLCAALLTSVNIAASAQNNPPANTFPERVGKYKLKRGPEHRRYYFDVDPVDSWDGYYELAENNTNSIGVRYTLLVYNSAAQAKSVLKLHTDTEVAGKSERGYRAKIVQQGIKPRRPEERFVILNTYSISDSGELHLYNTTVLWTNGPMLIRVECPTSYDPQQKRFELANGLKEAAPINFMRSHPN